MIWHLTFHTTGRTRLWTTPAELASELRFLARTCGAALLLFCVVDDHVHAVVLAERAEAGRLARRISRSLGARSGGLGPADIRPVTDRVHLSGLVGYLLRQSVRHALGVHPAAWPGSCFSDLVGARLLPGFDPRAIRRALPRLDDASLWRAVELAPVGAAIPAEAVRAMGPRAIADAGALALGVDPHGGSPEAIDARAVAIDLALAAELRHRVVAAEVGVAERSMRRLMHRQVPAERRAVIGRQLALRVALLTARPVVANESERRSLERARVLGRIH